VKDLCLVKTVDDGHPAPYPGSVVERKEGVFMIVIRFTLCRLDVVPR